jgi:acyl-CoA synthetase (AMP-forming)/AMP-acid ligase II
LSREQESVAESRSAGNGFHDRDCPDGDFSESYIDPAHSIGLGELSEEHRRSFPDRVAVVCGDTRLTFAELDDRVNRLANALQALGCKRGTTIAWVGQNCHRVIELLLSCAKVGAICSPLNWRWSAEEIAFALDDLGPQVVIWQESEISETVSAARSILRSSVRGTATAGRAWIQHDSRPSEYEELLEANSDAPPDVATDPSSSVLAIYTSAFGGRPKAALLNHLTLILRALCEALWNNIDHSYTYLNNGPMFHIGNWRTCIPTYVFGGTNVIVPRVEPTQMCALIEKERCTGAYLVPVTRQRLAEANADGRYDLKSLRDHGGDSIWLGMITPIRAFRGTGRFGQTEVGGIVASTFCGPPAVGNAGRSFPLVQIRIFDDGDRELGIGQVGEIVVRGLTVTNGYLHRPEESFLRSRGGWWHTGDLGRRESDGSISFVGPKERMLKSGSENIYPVEIEECLRGHPAVSDVAVIGVPDRLWIQSVKAIVVRVEGSTVGEDDLIDYCKARIASYKKPKFVAFVTELPRHQGGDINYGALDSEFGGGGYPGYVEVPEGQGGTGVKAVVPPRKE